MEAQGQRCGARALEEDEEDESLITEILTITPAKPVDTSVACLISWAGDGDDRGDYYEPDKVRIGPFHRQDPSQQSADWTEQEKKQALRGLLVSRVEEDEAGRREELRRYLRAMERIEPDARRCYNRTFSWLSSKEFARMLLLDGSFLYSRFAADSGGDDDIAVDRDVVFLLENQIPFFVLEEIHRLITGAKDVSLVLDRVATRVEQVLRRNEYTAVTLDRSSCTPPCHLLHLLYMCFRPPAAAAPDSAGPPKQMILEHNIRVPVPQVRWRTATQYAAAGVRFVKRELGNGNKDEASSILDVELSPRGGGTLHVPRLTIDANTFRLLRNMVALEQKGLQGTSRGSHVTAYCLFLSQLAGTEEDVALLVSKGIIVHLLRGDGDVAEELAGLCDGVVIDAYDPDTNYLMPKYEALEKLIFRRGRRPGGGRRLIMSVPPWLRRQGKCNNRLVLALMAALVVILLVQQSVSSALRNGRGEC